MLTKLTLHALVASALVDYVHQHTPDLHRAVPALHHGPECRRGGTTRLGTHLLPVHLAAIAQRPALLCFDLHMGALVRPHRLVGGLKYAITAGYDGVAAHGRACAARRNGTATHVRAAARGIQGTRSVVQSGENVQRGCCAGA